MSKCDYCRLRIFCPYENVADAEIMANCVYYIPPEKTCHVVYKTISFSEELVDAKCGGCDTTLDRFHSWERPSLPNYCHNCGAKVLSEEKGTMEENNELQLAQMR